MRGSRCEQCNFKTFCRVMNHCTKVQVKNEIPNDYTKEKNDKQTWKTLRSPSPYVCPWWPPPRPPWCRAPLLLSRPSSRCPPGTLQCTYSLAPILPNLEGDEQTLIFVCFFKVKLKYTGVQSRQMASLAWDQWQNSPSWHIALPWVCARPRRCSIWR